jgi:ABC-2 type transport system ATP-binding protein
MHALKISQLSKTYSGKEVVKKISLEIKEGEIFGLLGPNGAGKSTTINMISGVTKIGSGSVSVFGEDNQENFIFTRRAIGVMHQEIVVDTFFTIDRALKIHSGYYGVKDDPKWRNLLVERLALGPHLKKSMNKLSGGMKRRFMVAKALIHKPRLLILDEPTAGVDVELRQNLWEFVQEMNKQQGTTVLLTTHYLEEAEEMCERVAIMNHGEIIALDRTKDLLNKLDEKRILIHLDQAIQEIPAAMAGFASQLLDNGNSISVQLAKGVSTLSVLESIAKAKLPVREFETQAPSLQEAFLKLTKGTHV